MSRLTQVALGVCLMAVLLGGGAVLAADYASWVPSPALISSLEKDAREHPQDYNASMALASNYIAAGRYDDAERELERAETLSAKADDHSQVHLDRAEILLRQGNIDKGIAELRASADEAKSSDGSWWALYRLAQALRLYNRGGYAGVCGEMIDVGSASPGRWSTPMVMLAASGPPLGGPPALHWEAVAALVACAGKGSGSADVRARETMGPGLAEAAEAIPPDSPAYPAAAKALCWYYMGAGKLDLAAAAGERAVKLDPDHWMGHWLLARCYEDQKKFDDALKQYQEAARTAGNYLDVAASAAFCMSGIYERTGRLDLAFDEYQKAVLNYLAPWDPYHLAALALRVGKAKEALAFFQKNREQLLLATDPSDAPDLSYLVAAMCAAVGDRDGMVANLAPYLQDIQRMAGRGGWEGELLAEAAKAPDPAGRDLLLAIFEADSRFPADQVRTYAESAVAFAPDLPGANLLLAQLVTEKDPARAKPLAAKALAKAPAGSALAKQAQALLNELKAKP